MNARVFPLAGLVASVLVLWAPALASAAEKQVTASGFSFPPPAPAMDQGDTLTFVNQDTATHNVTATQKGTDGKPLFASKDVAAGSAKVEGAEFLTTGSYAFICSIHPSMTGTLTVSANGTPAVRPPDTTKPKVGVSFPKQTLAGILKAKKVTVKVTLDEPAGASVTVTARAGKKTVSLGPVKSTFKTATSRTLAIKLSSSALKTLGSASSVSFTAGGQATDRAGNVGRAKTAKLTASR